MRKITALCLGLICVQNCNSGSKKHHPTAAAKSSNLSIEGGGAPSIEGGEVPSFMSSEATTTETAQQTKAEAKAAARAAKAAAKAARRGGGWTPSTPGQTTAKQDITTIVLDAATNGANHVEKVFSEQEVTDMVQMIQTAAKAEILTIQTFTTVMKSIAGQRFAFKRVPSANINSVFAAAFKIYEKSDNTLDTQDLTDLLNGWDNFIANYAKTTP